MNTKKIVSGILVCILHIPHIYAEDIAAVVSDDTQKYITKCKVDLDFLYSQLKQNSVAYINTQDKSFQHWFDRGYRDSMKLINNMSHEYDCYYALKHYAYGFKNLYIGLESDIKLANERYPGIISELTNGEHKIIYKNPKLKYLYDINVGDKITHINNLDINEYYQNFLVPFYAHNSSEASLKKASLYTLLYDGNKFKPPALNITLLNNKNQSTTKDLKYTKLQGSSLIAANQIRSINPNKNFKLQRISQGIWIRIPSFFVKKEEEKSYINMLAKLKNQLAKESYIVFDMRGNLGGKSKWSRPILRNLWGDEFIQSLKSKHDYNMLWERMIRVSNDNFKDVQESDATLAKKHYSSLLKKKKTSFLKKWNIYEEQDNLYTNNDSTEFKAKIYVLTDHFCRRSCWQFVREITQIPGVIHIGQTITYAGIYSSLKKIKSPTGRFTFYYPRSLNVFPNYGVDNVLTPSYLYKGDFYNKVDLMEWVLSVTEHNK